MITGQVNPLISIVIITYNSEEYIQDALESVKNQNYTNIELIISDDASRDDTLAVCDLWLKLNKDHFVNAEIIRSIGNTGISSNLNRGLNRAKGEWVKFLAGDDILHEKCICKNVDFVNNTKDAKVVFSSVGVFEKYLINKRLSYTLPHEHQELFFKYNASEQYRRLLFGNFNWLAPSIFVNRRFLNSLGGFDERFPYFDDYPLWLKITKSNEKLFFYNEVTVFYRQTMSITRGKDIWISKRYFNSYFKHFKAEVFFNLLGQDKLFVIKKLASFVRYFFLVNVFRNKINWVSRLFNRSYNLLIPQADL
jgi:glycosyltransferase involved in cell wall biosynthesis